MIATNQNKEPVEAETEQDFDANFLRYKKPERKPRGLDMLVVTTFCKSDTRLMMKRAEYMRWLGLKPTHDLILIGDADVSQEEVNSMAEIHKDLFRKVLAVKIQGSKTQQAWPRGTNEAFRSTIQLLHGMYSYVQFDNMRYRGWYYFESDVTPLRVDFLTEMNQSFVQVRKPFMGVVGEIKAEDGTPIRHMNGSGVYPFGMQFFSSELMLVENMPWDVAGLSGLALEDVQDMTHLKYSMHFSTFLYKRTDPNHYEAIKRPHLRPEFPITCDILSTHLIHHGCKDASLMDDLMGKKESTLDITESFKDQFPKFVVSKKPPKKRRAKKSPNRKTIQQTPSTPEAIRADHKGGMKWKDLIKKHKLMPVALKKILEG